MDHFSQRTDIDYGRIGKGFSVDLPEKGFITFSGLNNAGKSTLLQWLFGRTNESIYIPAERGLVRPTTDSGLPAIDQFVDSFRSQVREQPLNSAQMSFGSMAHGVSFAPNEVQGYTQALLAALARSKGLVSSFTELRQYVADFGLGSSIDTHNDSILIDSQPISQLGTGARSLLTIILAIIHPSYKTILVDEPELFLEPRNQKLLVAFFREFSDKKRIIVATHSHLFLNRKEGEYGHNFYLPIETSGDFSIKSVKEKGELRELTFNLLGASFDDLMLPENYLVVEGDSDKVFMEKVLRLLGREKAQKVQIIFAQGIINTSNVVKAVREMIRPFYAEDSAYKSRVVCLVDGPKNKDEIKTIAGLEKVLNNISGNRCFTLGNDNTTGDALDLESVVPDEVYTRAGLVKDEVAQEISRLAGNHSDLGVYKSKIAERLSEQLQESDLDISDFAIIKDVALKTLEPVD